MYSLVDINEHSTASRRVLISIQSIEYGDYLCERTHNRTRKKSRYRTAIENIIIHEFELIQWNLSILLAHVWLYMISVPIWIQKCTNTTVSKRFNSSHCWLLQLQIIISTNATVRNLLQLTKEFLHTSISLYSIFTFSPIFLWRDNLKCFCDRTQFRYFLEEKNWNRFHFPYLVFYYSIFVLSVARIHIVKRSGNTYPTAIVQNVIGVTC